MTPDTIDIDAGRRTRVTTAAALNHAMVAWALVSEGLVQLGEEGTGVRVLGTASVLVGGALIVSAVRQLARLIVMRRAARAGPTAHHALAHHHHRVHWIDVNAAVTIGVEAWQS